VGSLVIIDFPLNLTKGLRDLICSVEPYSFATCFRARAPFPQSSDVTPPGGSFHTFPPLDFVSFVFKQHESARVTKAFLRSHCVMDWPDIHFWAGCESFGELIVCSIQRNYCYVCP